MIYFIGWLFCLIVALGFSLTSWVVVAASRFNGKIDKMALILSLCVACSAWYIVIAGAPFSISLK